MRLNTTRAALVGTIAISALALSGCAASTPAASSTGLSVVASTNVYGSIAESIGGDLVTVTSIISSAAQDPHSYEASAQDQLALSKADLVIENGAGYDPFIDTLLKAASSKAPVIDASEESGLLEGDHDHDEAEPSASPSAGASDDDDHEGHGHVEGFNEHVWYSFHGVEHVAEAIADKLSDLDSDNASTYEKNLAAFTAKIEKLEATAEAMQPATAGKGAAITEPVPLYLLQEAGFTNKTPAAFSEAIEEGTDVPPAVLASTLDLFTSRSVALLAYNSQTASSETEQVRAAAEANDIPVVEFTETMPDGADYVSWMTDNLNAIAAAVK